MNYNKNLKKNITFFVILCLAMAIVIFLLYNHFTSETTTNISTKNLIPSIHDAKINIKVNEKSVPYSSQGIEYNINFWILINDYNYRLNEDKIIVQKGNSYLNPSVMLEKNSNNLKIVVHTSFFNQNEESESDIESESQQNFGDINDNTEIFRVSDIKLQKWININVSLIDNNLDVFIDGKLTNSFVIQGYTKINTGNLNICPDGGFNGYITKLSYTNKSLSSKQIYSIFKKGPN